MRAACVLAALLAIGLGVSACGDGSADKAAPGSASNPLEALPNPESTRTPADPEQPGAARSGGAPDTPATLARQQRRVQRAAQRARANRKAANGGGEASGAPTSDGRRAQPLTTPPSARRPCSLVTRSQAARIIGGPVLEPLQAPQGPTCIYRSRSGKRFVTLAVQTVDFAKLKRQVRNSRRISVSDRPGLCGTVGQPMLYVPLSARRVLSVSAPCGVATRFAATAVSRLTA
jgi:hypothetical protein